MTPRDFFYWLQGYFELGTSGTHLDALDARQAECIIRHAALVEAPTERVIETRTMARMLKNSPSPEIAATMTTDLREIVASEFLHVIDPQDGDAAKQAALNKAHNPHLFKPGVTTPGGGVARC